MHEPFFQTITKIKTKMFIPKVFKFMQLRPLIDNNGLELDLVTRERETKHNFVSLSLMVSLSV